MIFLAIHQGCLKFRKFSRGQTRGSPIASPVPGLMASEFESFMSWVDDTNNPVCKLALGIIALLDRFVVNRVPVPGFSLFTSLSECWMLGFAESSVGVEPPSEPIPSTCTRFILIFDDIRAPSG